MRAVEERVVRESACFPLVVVVVDANLRWNASREEEEAATDPRIGTSFLFLKSPALFLTSSREGLKH